MAVRRNAFMLALLGLAGGFLTPYLLATGEDRPLALFFYVLLLDAGILAVTRRRPWPVLGLLGLLGSGIVFAGWASSFLDAVKLPYALAAAAILAALFAAFAPSREAPGGAAGGLGAVIRILAVGGPFLLALAVSPEVRLDAPPLLLVLDLLVLCAGAFWVSEKAAGFPLLPAAAGSAVLTLMLRAGKDVFPARRVESLLLFALVGAEFFVFWLLRRRKPAAVATRVAAGIALGGSFLVMAHAMSVEPATTSILPLWLFAAAHAAGLAAIGAVEGESGWLLGAQAYLWASLAALLFRFTQSRLPEFLLPVLAPGLLFWALPFGHRVFRRDALSWVSSAIAPVGAFSYLYFLARPSWGNGPLGALAVGLGLLAFAALRRASSLLSADPAASRRAAALFGAVTLLFVTAAIPILLDREWITVAWALEAAALAWLNTRLREPGLVRASAALAAATFLRLVANEALWSYHARSGTPIANWYLYTFGVPAAAFLFAARWCRGDEAARRLFYAPLLRTAAGILAFVLVNVEIADYFSTGLALTFRLSGGGLAEDMAYSLAWGVFGVLLLAVGITTRSRATRAAALGVLLLTIGKVFLHDLWDLGALYRVGSIVALAIALLAVSFLIQRFVLRKDSA